MSRFPRYAIYYVPSSDDAIYRFGTGALGYDAFDGARLPFADVFTNAVADWQDLSAEPRKYGFHATLKAPFALAPGRSEAELLAACASFAATPRRVPVIVPTVRAISHFIAIVPAERSAALEALAQDCVEAFDDFRAALTPEDRARRKPEALSPRQVAYLDRWGYPYVAEEFRFHMTLTGRVPDERRDAILAMLRDAFRDHARPSLAVDRIAVFRQDDERARFRVIAHHALQAFPATVG